MKQTDELLRQINVKVEVIADEIATLRFATERANETFKQLLKEAEEKDLRA